MEKMYQKVNVSVLFVLVMSLLVAIPFIGATRQISGIEVEEDLLVQIAADESAGYLVYFSEKADLSPAYKMGWKERGRFVANALQETAKRSQSRVLSFLNSQGAKYQAFWVDNVIVVESSDSKTFNGLFNFSEIDRIITRREPILYEPVVIEPNNMIQAIESNLTHVGADQVWATGVTGQGIVVANIDTGVRYTHHALVNQYRGNLDGTNFDHNYNWWDPYSGTTSPADVHDHGSHTMGTMVGDDGGANQIGMAPGARWIAAKGFNPGATDAGLLSCGQFMVAPTNLAGANPNPDLRPHVINNSWGDCGRSYDGWYSGVINSWHAAGIYPVFSNGNASNCSYPQPPGLNTVGNPARYGNVTGVGATGRNNGQYATYSNWGPTDNEDTINPRGYPYLKPQVSAPGTNRSAYRGSDTSYGDMSGTSMAAPHVSGLVALIWSAAPWLVGDYSATETIIEQTANPIPYNTGGTPPPGPGDVPNYATGWGEINAIAAVQAAIESGGDCILQGIVTDAVTHDPINGALVEADSTTSTLKAYTNALGEYALNLWEGSYTVTGSAYGYENEVIPGVVTSPETPTIQDIALTPATFYTVEGVVTDSITGWPLYASIDIDGYPGPAIWTNPVTGYYSISLSENTTFKFNVSAWVNGYLPKTVDVGPLTADQTENIDLDPDLTTCEAPGYAFQIAYEEDFEADNGGYTPGGTPADLWQWGTPTTWPNSAASGTKCWGTNLSGNYPINADATLLSPVIDLSSASAPLLLKWWQAIHIESSAYDHAYAEVSINGGSWQTMWQHTSSSTQVGWTEYSYDLTAAAGGNIQLRFRLTSDYVVNYSGYYIDNISITGGCIVPTGGLIVGNVYDDNTNNPLNDATVENEDMYSFNTRATPFDTAVDDGFYVLYSPVGNKNVTASKGIYTPDIQSVDVPTGDAIEQDFYLTAGQLTVVPDSMHVTFSMGANATLNMTITNTGTESVNFEITEQDMGYEPCAVSYRVVNNQTMNPVHQPRKVELSLAPPSLNAGKPTTTWNPMGAVQLVLDDGSAEDSIGLTGGGQFVWLNRFTPNPADFPFTLQQISIIFNNTVTVGDSMQLVIWEDTDGDGNPGTGANYLYSETVTVQNNDFVTWNTYTLITPVVLYGPNDVLIGVVNRSGVGGYSDYPAAIDLTASQVHSWIGAYSAGNPPDPPTLPSDDLWGTIDSFGFPGNWMIRGSGVTGSVDVPWLSESPITGTIPASGSVIVDVTFDSGVPQVTQPGNYYAFLKIIQNTPYPTIEIPAQMTAIDGGSLQVFIEPEGARDAGAQWRRTGTTGWLDSGQIETAVPVGPHTVEFKDIVKWITPDDIPVTVVENERTTATGTYTELIGELTVEPDSLHATVDMGDSTVMTITLNNIGTWPVAFEIEEQDMGYEPCAVSYRVVNNQTTNPVNQPRKVELSLAPPSLNAGKQTNTWTPMGAVQLLLDDGSAEDSIGLTAGGQFVWLNRFTPNPADFPFILQQISIIFNNTVTVGDSMQLVIWEDTDGDGDPGTGANYLYSETVTVQNNDFVTWNTYTLTTPVILYGPNDVLIGVVNRSGVGGYSDYPAAIDLTASQVRSWIGSYSAGNPPDPPTLPGDDLWGTIDSFGFPGNWMIRGSGVTGLSDVPWLSESPITGTIPAGGSVIVDVTFDSGVPEVTKPGNYFAMLKITNDTPYPTPEIPVQMTAVDGGSLQVFIEPQGARDAGAQWRRAGTVTWFNSGDVEVAVPVGDYDVELSDIAGWITPEDIPVTIAENERTTTTATYVQLIGELSADPDSLHVYVVLGESTTQNLTLSNVGNTGLTFEISEKDVGFLPAVTVAPANTRIPVTDSPAPVETRTAIFAESGIAGGPRVEGPASGGPAPEDIGIAWEVMTPLPSARVFCAVVADGNGYVYVIGGTSDASGSTKTNTNFRYNTGTDSWDTMSPMPVSLSEIDGAYINGKIYIPGDDATATTYVYNIATDSWDSIAANNGYTSRVFYGAMGIGNDLYVIGGIDYPETQSTTEVWILDTTTGTWSAGVPMQKQRINMNAEAIDGVIYVAGGVAFPGFTPDMTAEKFDGASWSYIASVPNGGGAYTRWSYAADGHGKDGLWIGAGRRDTNWAVLNHAGYYNPETDTWTDSPTIPMLNQGRVYMEGTVASDGYFYVIGGRDSAGAVIYNNNERLYVGSPTPPNVPWLSEYPTTGTIAAEDSLVVQVTFDAGVPEVTALGDYDAILEIKSDALNPLIQIPVRMSVVEKGDLQVFIEPQGAIDAGAQWSVDSGANWYDSGTSISLVTGDYTVSFKNITGWDTPAPQNITINSGALTIATGTYIRQTGSLMATITPQGARDAGAQWRRVGTSAWFNSDVTEPDIPTGAYSVEFKPIPDWDTPSPQSVTIYNDILTTTSGTYVRHTGSLTVTITPQGAIDAGAQWRRVGTSTWFNSGVTEPDIPTGAYSVEFKPIAGWDTPANANVTIIKDTTETAEGEYIRQTGDLKVSIEPQGAIDAGAQWSADAGANWYNSGTSISLETGNYNVSFNNIPDWDAPSTQSVTIYNDVLTTTTGVYARHTGSLKVTITPQEAIDAGAQWRRVGSVTWFNSDATESNIPTGAYVVEFKSITDWNTPANININIVKSQTTITEGTYTLIPIVVYTFDEDEEGWTFAGKIPPYDTPTSSVLAGYLGLSAHGSVNCFSYWYSPDLILDDSGTYLSKWTLMSTETDPDATVDFRLRINQKGTWRGWNRIVGSNNQQAPSLSNPKTYDMIFDPTVTGADDNKFVMNFDITSFDIFNATSSWLVLDTVEVYSCTVVPGLEIVHYGFVTDEEGWTFQGEVPPFTIPISAIAPGKLGLCANGQINCFSYWFSPDITVEDGEPYVISFQMGTTSVNPDLAESFRIRVNQRGSWQGWDTVVNSNMQHAPSASESKIYNVYIIPNVTGTNGDDSIVLSGDLMSFDLTDDHMAWSIIESVRVQEMDIHPSVIVEE